MDPLGTAAQAGGTVCWKGQEQGCQYQGTANRLFYKLALISEVVELAGAMQCGSTHQRCPEGQAPSPGSKACCSSAIHWNPQCQAGVKGLHSLACNSETAWCCSAPWHVVSCRLQDHLQPGSIGSPGRQADSKCHSVLTAPKAVAASITCGEKPLEAPQAWLSPLAIAQTASLSPLHSALCIYIPGSATRRRWSSIKCMGKNPDLLIPSAKSCYKKYIPRYISELALFCQFCKQFLNTSIRMFKPH